MWARTEAVLEDAIARGITPGIAACVRRDGALLGEWHLGQAELRPLARPCAAGTAFDLASLTKVLCTSAVALALHARHQLVLHRPAFSYLGRGPKGVSLEHLLQHASGLPAWGRLYDKVIQAGAAWGSDEARSIVLEQVLQTPLEAAPGERHRYSDLGFLLLGAALEKAGGAPIDALFEELVRRPSGAEARFGWAGAAATEDCPVRGQMVVGTVHDLNAAVLGGVAPHAGLFGTARGVAALAAWWLDGLRAKGPGFPVASVRTFFERRGPGSHALGWDTKSPTGSSAGSLWPADGLGHTGFTGTSVWMSPSTGVVAVLLTNRVHPDIEGGAVPDAPPGPRTQAFRQLRPAFHDALLSDLAAAGPPPRP